MIFARSHGRLGNQLFHWTAIETMRKRQEWLVLIGFDSLAKLLPLDGKNKIIRIPNPAILDRPFKSIERTLRKLAHKGHLGRIVEDKDKRKLIRTDSKRRIAVLDAGNYQDWHFFNSDSIVAVSEGISRRAALKGMLLGAPNECFVHIRRGDYLFFPSYEDSSALPDSWYQDAMLDIENHFPDVQFKVFSDDPAYVRDHFGHFKNLEIVNCDESEAFLQMANSSSGILSASTFSLWASVLADRNGATGPFIGPRYWLGWRKKRWNPAELRLPFVTYKQVA